MLSFALIQDVKTLMYAQEEVIIDCSPTQPSISTTAQLILFQKYHSFITTIYSPPQDLNDEEKNQYITTCLWIWEKEIMWMGACLDDSIQDDKDDDSFVLEDLGMDMVIVRPALPMLPAFSEHWEFSSQGAKRGYLDGIKITRKWRKDISDEMMKTISNTSVSDTRRYTRSEKICKHPQIEALLYLYEQLKQRLLIDCGCPEDLNDAKNPGMEPTNGKF
jgi:hypothetical protein